MDSLINRTKFRVQELLGKYKVSNYLNYLRRSQFLSKKEIYFNQSEKLKKLINFSAKNIKFYSDFFKNNNINPSVIEKPEDLVKLPVMTKEIYRSHFPEYITDPNAHNNDYFLNSTSGSTGTPFSFYMSHALRSHAAAILLLFYEWGGRMYGESLVRMWGLVNKNLKIKVFNKFIENALVINAFDLSENTFPKFYKKILKKKPKLLESYTSGAFAFALFMKKNNLSLNIPSTIVSGETLYDFQKEIIEEQFNTKIFNRYGTREFGNIAQECSEHKGLHICEEDFIIEILNENNEPVNIGDEGKIVVTCLNNFVMPFIRYQIEDIGTLSPEECTCERNYVMFKSVSGRISDMIYSPSGRHISLYFFALVFQGLSDFVSEFQILQQKKNKDLIVKIVPTNSYNENIEKKIINQIKQMDNSFNISLEKVDYIYPESTGKKKYLKIV